MPTSKSRAEYMRNWRRKRKAELAATAGTPYVHAACDRRENELLDEIERLKSENRDLRALLPF